MLKGSCDLTALRLVDVWTGARVVPWRSSFLISTIWFLVLNNAFRNGSILTRSTVCSSAAETNEIANYGTAPS